MEDFSDVVEAVQELASNGTSGKTWTSYGQVIPDADGAHSVRFNGEDGSPLPHGVLVDVKLQPSGNVVPCRVASQCAGNGEGEFHPFVSGDEVLVVIPEGDERAGCVIIGRLNQSHDVFPAMVAGMDVTQNNLAFKRNVAPFVWEVGTSWMVRSATTGAGLTFDQTGQVWLTDADGTMLAMTPDVVSLMLADEAAGLQIDVSNKQVNLIAGSTNFQVSATKSQLQTGGTLSVSTMGNIPQDHVATVEGTVTVLSGLLTVLAAAFATLGATPVTGIEIAALFAPGPATILLNGAIAASVLPPSSVAPYLAAINAALSVKKVPGVLPTPGCAGFQAD